MSKERRRSLLLDILRSEAAFNQEDLVAKLREQGEAATQATVSRDLNALGAYRGPSGYVISDSGMPPGTDVGQRSELLSVVKRHVVAARAAHSLTVVRTAPGHAQMVASSFDRWTPDGVVGTVAGDDTIFLATVNPKTAEKLSAELNRIVRGERS